MNDISKERKIPSKREELYRKQVELLKTFLANGAISQTQFDKSFNDLTEKMGMK